MTDPTPRRPRLDEMMLESDDDRRVLVSCPAARVSTPDWIDEQPVETLGGAVAAGLRHLERFHPEPNPAGPGDEMRALLVAGGRYTGRLSVQGAVHLLTFTDVPAWRGFPALVHIERVDDTARGETYDAAFVPSWPTLLEDTRAAHVSGSARRLLALAVSMAVGAPVDLRENLTEFGHATTRRVLEAVAIATGADEFYTLIPTPKLAEVEAFHRQMQGGHR